MAEPLFPETTFPALDANLFDVPTQQRLVVPSPSRHRPRFLMLDGSLRERSFSRLLSFEAARLLEAMGGEVRIFDPAGLPLPDGAPDSHPKVQELRELAAWSEGMVWTSPERHGAIRDGGAVQVHLAHARPGPLPGRPATASARKAPRP